MKTTTTGFAIAAVVLLALASTYFFTARLAGASAPSGLPATVATTSTPTVTTAASIIAATSSCASRIITTYASPLMLTFTDRSGERPSGIKGHLQAASTTVAYDSGQYGCGAVYGYSFTSQTLYVSETR